MTVHPCSERQWAAHACKAGTTTSVDNACVIDEVVDPFREHVAYFRSRSLHPDTAPCQARPRLLAGRGSPAVLGTHLHRGLVRGVAADGCQAALVLLEELLEAGGLVRVAGGRDGLGALRLPALWRRTPAPALCWRPSQRRWWASCWPPRHPAARLIATHEPGDGLRLRKPSAWQVREPKSLANP